MNHARNIRLELEAIIVNYPENTSLTSAIAHLCRLEEDFSKFSPSKSTWSALAKDMQDLQDQGVWGTVLEQKRIWTNLSDAMKHSDSPNRPDISIVMPPTLSRIPVVFVPSLPPELLEQINEVYLLHKLATDPSKVLPPGKSLLSLLSSRTRRTHEAGDQELKTLQDQVSEAVTRAFWDEALESLSSPTPAVQLTRLRLLYTDLRTAIEPLVPSSHSTMYTLSEPLSPTSSPLRSASADFRTLLSVLRERCAPLRDAEIDAILARLDDPPLSELPTVCVETARRIFGLADKMKADLADFVVGTWTEQDARRWIRRESIERERSVVLRMFSSQMVKDSYHEWLGSGSEASTRPVVARLLKALGSPDAVSPFPPSNNMLPPPFIFTAFDLLKVQNLLQALVIAASLRSLVRPVDNPDVNWLSRVWTLLEMETEKGGSEAAETKLLNLEDEVVHAARVPKDEDAEGHLREAVRRTLRPQDHVFVLLQSRLLSAIQARLVERPNVPTPAQMPTQMRTGRGKLPITERDAQDQETKLLVKGFEDPVLKENVTKVVGSLRVCLQWMQDGWEGFLGDNAM